MRKEFPIIETSRLLLRALTQKDAGALFEYFSQDAVTEYYDVSTFTSIREAESLIRVWRVAFELSKAIRWAIVLNETNEVIGTCGFHNFEEEHNRTEMGYELNPKFWQQGYMTEAITAIQKYAFGQLNLHRIEVYTDPFNLASRRLLNKVGFKSEGVLRDYFWSKGRFIDGEIFSILEHEWENHKNGWLLFKKKLK